MKKRLLSLFLSLVPLLLLAGCEKERPFGGLLTSDEVIQCELLYGEDMETFQQAQGISDKEIEQVHGGDRWRLYWKRKIEGEAFTQNCLASKGEEGGLYGVRYELRLKDGQEKKALSITLALYEHAMEAYGKPTTDPGVPNRISESLDVLKKNQLLDCNFEETWDVGVDSEFTIFSMIDVEEAVIYLTYQSKDAPEQ